MKNILNNKNGLGIIAAILIMLIVAVMGVTVSSLLGTNAQGSVNYLQSQQAFYLAESGVQAALYQLSKGGGTWTGWSGTDPKTIQLTLTGYGDYNVSVASPASTTPVITSTGYVPTRTASYMAKRVVNPTAFNKNLFATYAAYAGGSGGGTSISVSMTGGTLSDSYNSSIGLYGVNGNIGNQGNIGTNASISMTGGSTINGQATVGPTGTCSGCTVPTSVTVGINNNGNTVLPAVVVPGSLTSLASSGSAPNIILPGNYKYTDISATSHTVITITGPAQIYLTGNSTSISLKAQSQITISAASTGPVVIYVDGSVDAGGGGIVNATLNPANFQLYATSTSQAVSYTGSSALYGAIYAPSAVLTLNGGAGLFGSFIGDSMTLTGGSGIHHDTNLSNLTATPPFFPTGWGIENWKEVY